MGAEVGYKVKTGKGIFFVSALLQINFSIFKKVAFLAFSLLLFLNGASNLMLDLFCTQLMASYIKVLLLGYMGDNIWSQMEEPAAKERRLDQYD